MKKTHQFLLTLLVIMLMSVVIYAQPPGFPTVPSEAPIDGGLGLLAAAGGAYAFRKLRNLNKT